MGECPSQGWEKVSRTLTIYAHTASYRLKLCSTKYKIVPKCSVSKFSVRGHSPTHPPLRRLLRLNDTHLKKKL